MVFWGWRKYLDDLGRTLSNYARVKGYSVRGSGLYHVLSILRVRLIGAMDENRSILIAFHKHSVHENIHSYIHEFIFYNA